MSTTEFGVAYMTVKAAYPNSPDDWAEQQATRCLADPDFYADMVARVERVAADALERLEVRLGL